MSYKINWSAWVKLLLEDAEWAEKQPRTLERDHVIGLLRHLTDEKAAGAREFYQAQPEPWPHA